MDRHPEALRHAADAAVDAGDDRRCLLDDVVKVRCHVLARVGATSQPVGHQRAHLVLGYPIDQRFDEGVGPANPRPIRRDAGERDVTEVLRQIVQVRHEPWVTCGELGRRGPVCEPELLAGYPTVEPAPTRWRPSSLEFKSLTSQLRDGVVLRAGVVPRCLARDEAKELIELLRERLVRAHDRGAPTEREPRRLGRHLDELGLDELAVRPPDLRPSQTTDREVGAHPPRGGPVISALWQSHIDVDAAGARALDEEAAREVPLQFLQGRVECLLLHRVVTVDVENDVRPRARGAMRRDPEPALQVLLEQRRRDRVPQRSPLSGRAALRSVPVVLAEDADQLRRPDGEP